MLRRLLACQSNTLFLRVGCYSVSNRPFYFRYYSTMGGVLSYLPFNYGASSSAQHSDSPDVTDRNSHVSNGTTIDTTKLEQDSYPEPDLEEISTQESSSGSDDGDEREDSVIELADETLTRRSHDSSRDKDGLVPDSKLKNYWDGERYIVRDRGVDVVNTETGEVMDLDAIMKRSAEKARKWRGKYGDQVPTPKGSDPQHLEEWLHDRMFGKDRPGEQSALEDNDKKRITEVEFW